MEIGLVIIALLLLTAIMLVVGAVLVYRKLGAWHLRWRNARYKGAYAERMLKADLRRMGAPDKQLFSNLYVKMRNGKYAQIDAVLVSNAGIIVFEVKNYAGWIYGSGDNRYWTQVLAKGHTKNQLYNPVWQNNKHLTVLREKLGVDSHITVHSVVVFYGNCKLKSIGGIDKDVYVIKSSQLKNTLRHIKETTQKVKYKNLNHVMEQLGIAQRNGLSQSVRRKHQQDIYEASKIYYRGASI